MSLDRFSKVQWRLVALCILLCYPIMVVKWLPFGGGSRYLSVLAAPVSLLLLCQAPRSEVRSLLLAAWRWCLPFLPFVLIWIFAQAWHGYDPMDLNSLTRLLWCAFLFVGARLAGVTNRHLAVVAGVAAMTYCAVAVVEVYSLGRPRAWGGTYENRFGEYSIWVAALCCLHVFYGKQEGKSRVLIAFLLIAGVCGGIATLLSGSRGAFLALVVTAIVAFYKARDWRKGLLVAISVMVAIVAFCVFYGPAYARVELSYREIFNYFNEPTFTPTSIGIRLELFRVAFLTLLDHPVLGSGYTSLKQLYESHPALGAPLPEMLAIPGFHNDWGQAIGVGGGLLLAALVTTVAWLGVSSSGNVYRLAFLGFAVIFSFSEIFFTNKLGLSLLMASWALYSAAEQNQTHSV